MNNNASAVAASDRINHVTVVVFALLASLIIMLIGITVRATDHTNYGIGAVGDTMIIPDRGLGSAQ